MRTRSRFVRPSIEASSPSWSSSDWIGKDAKLGVTVPASKRDISNRESSVWRRAHWAFLSFWIRLCCAGSTLCRSSSARNSSAA